MPSPNRHHLLSAFSLVPELVEGQLSALKLSTLKSFSFQLSAISLTLLLLSCQSEEDTTPYPSLISNFADVQTDADSRITTITFDDATTLTSTNTIANLSPNTIHRLLLDYSLSSSTTITIHKSTPIHLLHDSTLTPLHDPTAVTAAWITPRYINLHLQPKTKGATHYWGYVTDSITATTTYLSLHHNQNSDPLAFSTSVYASLPTTAITTPRIHLTITTFKGPQSYQFNK